MVLKQQEMMHRQQCCLCVLEVFIFFGTNKQHPVGLTCSFIVNLLNWCKLLMLMRFTGFLQGLCYEIHHFSQWMMEGLGG